MAKISDNKITNGIILISGKINQTIGRVIRLPTRTLIKIFLGNLVLET
jgi:hypothetical protein